MAESKTARTGTRGSAKSTTGKAFEGFSAEERAARPMAGCSVSLSGDDADLLRGYWDKLSAGGTITMPMRKQVWGDEFGMCVDKFGVSWMVNISQP